MGPPRCVRGTWLVCIICSQPAAGGVSWAHIGLQGRSQGGNQTERPRPGSLSLVIWWLGGSQGLNQFTPRAEVSEP